MFEADPNSRLYAFDSNGEISFVPEADDVDRDAYPTLYARIKNLSLSGQPSLRARNIRVLLPRSAATHVLYVHDGQNVLRRDSSIPAGYSIPFGGWQLDDAAPAGLMIVAIDNTADRFFDYTHVTDRVSNTTVGGGGDLYADFVADVVRPAVDAAFGEPAVRGTMGSSLGGLIALHVADRHPTAFHMAIGLSSTFGWGSIGNNGADDGDNTLIDRFVGKGVRFKVAIDSGGDDGTACADSDGDGILDDVSGGDNFCETLQMRGRLVSEGHVLGVDAFYDYDPGVDGRGAQHREDAWAFRAATIHMPRFMTLSP